MAGFKQLPNIPRESLISPARLEAFLNKIHVLCEAKKFYDAGILIEAALRNSIVDWSPPAYYSLMRMLKRWGTQIPEWKPLALHYQGWQQFVVGEPERAIATYKRCIRAWENLDQDADAAEAKIAMARIFQSLGNLDKAIEVYSESIDLLEKAGQPHARAAAFALHSLADVLIHRLKLDDAEKYCRQSLRLLSTSDHTSIGYGPATTLRTLGNIYRVRGDWSAAIKYYQRSLLDARHQQNLREEAYTLNCIAATYLKTGESKTAEEFFRKSLEIVTELKDQDWIALNLAGLGDLAAQKEKYNEALSLLSQAREILATTGAKYHLAGILVEKAAIHIRIGMYDAARELITEGRDVVSKLGNLRIKALLLEQDGWLNFKSGNPERAEALFLESLEIFSKANIEYKQRDLLTAIKTLRAINQQKTNA